jgi:hypothetical protein
MHGYDPQRAGWTLFCLHPVALPDRLASRRGGTHESCNLRIDHDAVTFRHVKSVYKVEFGFADYPDQLEETFSDFKQVNGLTLPALHSIHYLQSNKHLLLETT